MLTLVNLIEELGKFLEEKVATEIELKTYSNNEKKFEMKKPKVIKGLIIPKINETGRDIDSFAHIPFINIGIKDFVCKDDENIATVKIIFANCCYGSYKDDELIEDMSGYRDILNLAEKIRFQLYKQKKINNQFELVDDFKTVIPNEQPYPLWEGYIEAKFYLMPVHEEGVLYE